METGISANLRSNTTATRYVHPEDSSDIAYWSRKWDVTPRQIQQAILHTGTVHAPTLKEYLKRDSWFYHPLEGTAKLVKYTIDYIF